MYDQDSVQANIRFGIYWSFILKNASYRNICLLICLNYDYNADI